MPPSASSQPATLMHAAVALLELFVLCGGFRAINEAGTSKAAAHRRAVTSLSAVLVLEAGAHLFVPWPALSVTMMTVVSVLFTISPVEGPSRLSALHMGSVPPGRWSTAAAG